jgi:hypothetical protein
MSNLPFYDVTGTARSGGNVTFTNASYQGGFGASNFSSYMGFASAASNIFSGISKYKQYSDNAELLAANSKAVWEEYKINKLAMDRNAVKQFGALQARTGEGGSAMDLLQESAMNYAVDAWRLKFNAQQKYNMLKKQEKAAKKASKGALGGSIGTAVGIVAGVALGVMTGGVGFAALAGAGALGGSLGGAAGSTIGQM